MQWLAVQVHTENRYWRRAQRHSGGNRGLAGQPEPPGGPVRQRPTARPAPLQYRQHHHCDYPNHDSSADDGQPVLTFLPQELREEEERQRKVRVYNQVPLLQAALSSSRLSGTGGTATSGWQGLCCNMEGGIALRPERTCGWNRQRSSSWQSSFFRAFSRGSNGVHMFCHFFPLPISTTCLVLPPLHHHPIAPRPYPPISVQRFPSLAKV